MHHLPQNQSINLYNTISYIWTMLFLNIQLPVSIFQHTTDLTIMYFSLFFNAFDGQNGGGGNYFPILL
jgi:hypothetical protein